MKEMLTQALSHRRDYLDKDPDAVEPVVGNCSFPEPVIVFSKGIFFKKETSARLLYSTCISLSFCSFSTPKRVFSSLWYTINVVRLGRFVIPERSLNALNQIFKYESPENAVIHHKDVRLFL